MRKRLFWKVFAGFACISILGVGIFSFYTLRTLRTMSADSLTARLRDVALAVKVAADGLIPGGRSPALDALARDIAGATGTRITVIDGRGKVLADSEQDPAVMENHTNRPEVSQALEGTMGTSTRFSGTVRQWMVYVAVPAQLSTGAVGVLRASAPIAQLDAAFLREGGGLALFASILFAACLAVALVISRTIAAPLRDLAGIVSRFAEGDFGARLHLRRLDEVRALAESFNMLGERIQQLFLENSARVQELDGIFSSVGQGIVLLDGDERIVRWNKGFEDLAGGRVAAGMTMLEVLAAPLLADLVRRARTSGDRQSEEIALGDRTLLATIERMAGRDQLVVLLNDTTDLHRLEAMKRDFVANASHELRTPLTTISGSLEMLEGQVAGGETARWIDVIRRNAERMTAIVGDLLLLSRLEAKGVEPVREPVDLASIAREVAAMFGQRAESRGLALRLDIGEPLPPLIADPLLMEQMLVNLVDNALKYTEHGEVLVSCAAGNDGVRIEVADTGIGMAAEHLPRIFERFYVVDKSRSRRMGGTGLGLAIVKHIVQRHYGTIEVASEPLGGTRFTIRLPARPPGWN
jgi:two-component system, OmpR family, phosphate regulon sensor histidine kinase PhoR